VRNMHHVVVQSERQAQMCRRTFGRDSTCINSCYAFQGAPGRTDGPIVWVGTVKPLKRPELLLDLAQRLPQFRFRLVGGAAAGVAHFEALQRRAQSLGNVEMTGFVPYADVEAQFDGASLLVNTSVGEGFPNTFLQAWSGAIPTVSFFDTGARVNGVDVGTTVPDLDSMERSVQALKTDSELWHEHGARAADYFRRHHTVASAVDDYEHIFQDFSLTAREARV